MFLDFLCHQRYEEFEDMRPNLTCFLNIAMTFSPLTFALRQYGHSFVETCYPMTLSSTTKASNKISLPLELQRTSLQQLYLCVTRYVSKSICQGTMVCNNSSRLVGAVNLTPAIP